MPRPIHVLALLALAALQGGCGAPRAGAPLTSPAATSRGEESYVEAGDGVRLYARVLGGARPDTIVVLHGGPGFSTTYFGEDLRTLAERHTLILYDQRGAGRSTLVADSAALSGERFAHDLEAVRRHFWLERMTLLGHSWGAAVAALYAARHPEHVAGMLIVGGIPLRLSRLEQTFQDLESRRDSVERRRLRETREAWHAEPGDAAACRAYYAIWFRPFFADPADMARSTGDICGGTPESRRNKVASVDRFTAASLGRWDWEPALRGVSARTLVLQGTADVFPPESAREWAAALPNARVLLLDGVGHFPYLEAPRRFNEAVSAFMAGGWPDGAVAGTGG